MIFVLDSLQAELSSVRCFLFLISKNKKCVIEALFSSWQPPMMVTSSFYSTIILLSSWRIIIKFRIALVQSIPWNLPICAGGSKIPPCDILLLVLYSHRRENDHESGARLKIRILFCLLTILYFYSCESKLI